MHAEDEPESTMTALDAELDRLGLLHDCRLVDVAWDHRSGRMELRIADLHANFAGLPGYEGPRPGALVFEDLRVFRIVQPAKDRIFEVERVAGSGAIEIRFVPAGRWIIEAGRVFVRPA